VNAYRRRDQSIDQLSSRLPGASQNSLRHAPSRSHYRLLGLVGRGQYGKVFLGVHRSTGQLFALKELDQDRFPTHQFLRELRFLLTLQHPNIVTCWACDYWMQHRYLVTDYCEGGTLRQWMDSMVSLRFGQREDSRKQMLTALSIVEGILAGLVEAHEKNIIHCDIKPENILLEIRSDSVLPRIADFGIARVTQDLNKPSFTGTGMSGSPAYMAPERFFGQHSVSADLYAIGILMYELLMGDRPFSGTPGALRAAHLNNIVILPPALPDSLKVILLRALAKLPGQRYRNAHEMRLAILNVIQEIQRSPSVILDLNLMISVEIPALALKQCSYESIQHPIQQLLIQPVQNGETGEMILYRIESTKVRFGRFKQGAIEGSGKQLHRLSDSIDQAWPSASGCYIATSSQLYYCDEDWLKPCLEDPIPEMITIDPAGYWFTQVTPDSVQLFCPEQQFPRWERARSGEKVIQVAAVDSRHFVMLVQSTNEQDLPCLQIEVWNRRGDRLGEMPLQVSIDRLWPTLQGPFLIATESASPQSLLLIQLQPLQVRRVALPFEPKVVGVLTRGIVAIDRLGRGLVLNRSGEVVARLRLPENPTAVTVVDDRYLLISTWASGMGTLSAFDMEPLQELL
jgi:serine/threonine protein kinase